jgi:hypothetical protein
VAADQRRHDALIRAVQGIVNGVGAADDATNNATPAPTCAQNENQTAASQQIRHVNARPSAAADDDDRDDESEEGEDSAAQVESRRPRTDDAAAEMLLSSRDAESERVLGEGRAMPARTMGVDGDGDADASTALHRGDSGQGAPGGGGMRLSLRHRVPTSGAVVVATSGAASDRAATLAVQNAAADIEAALTETGIDDDSW